MILKVDLKFGVIREWISEWKNPSVAIKRCIFSIKNALISFRFIIAPNERYETFFVYNRQWEVKCFETCLPKIIRLRFKFRALLVSKLSLALICHEMTASETSWWTPTQWWRNDDGWDMLVAIIRLNGSFTIERWEISWCAHVCWPFLSLIWWCFIH